MKKLQTLDILSWLGLDPVADDEPWSLISVVVSTNTIGNSSETITIATATITIKTPMT